MLAGIDVRELDARKFTNLIHGILSQGLDPSGIAELEKWLSEDAPVQQQLRQETPEEMQERLRPTWGTTPDAIAGQEAMIAMVQGAR